MGALLAYPTIAEEDQPLYDGKQASQKRHLTVIDDRAVDHVIEQCGFTAAGIYTLLERRANRHGVCVNISYQGLADKGGLSRRQVIRLMQDLQTAGFVEVRERVVRGRHTENEFYLPHHFSAPASGDMAPDIIDGVVTSSGDMVVTWGSDTVVTSSGDTPGPSTSSSDMGGDTSGDTLLRISNHVSSPSTQGVEAAPPVPEPESFGEAETPPPVKPLPMNGPAQRLVAWWCKRIGEDAPADYSKAVGQAQKLFDRGIKTPTDANTLYDYCIQRLEGGITLGSMLACLDGWKAAKARPAAARGTSSYDPYTTPDL